MKAEHAEPLYKKFCSAVEDLWIHIEKGIFGADMKVSLINDEPVTIIMKIGNRSRGSQQRRLRRLNKV